MSGGTTSRGAMLVDLVLCGCAAYRTQLFLDRRPAAAKSSAR